MEKKGSFSKATVVGIIFLNIFFTVAIFYLFLRVGSEPSVLIGSWFGFTTVELWNLARIKKEKIKGECEDETRNI